MNKAIFLGKLHGCKTRQELSNLIDTIEDLRVRTRLHEVWTQKGNKWLGFCKVWVRAQVKGQSINQRTSTALNKHLAADALGKFETAFRNQKSIKPDHTINYLANQILAGHPQCLLGDTIIDLPAPQRAGTESQTRDYAEMKAGQILANL